MQKKIFAFGNSGAIVLDEGIRRRLGVAIGSLLHLTFEGHRLMIERSENDAASPEQIAWTKTATAIGTLRNLLGQLDAHGMSNQHLERLSYDRTRAGLIHGWASSGEMNPVTLVRLKKCLARRVHFKEPWETTIETVLANTPSPLQARRRGRAPREWSRARCPRRAPRGRRRRSIGQPSNSL